MTIEEAIQKQHELCDGLEYMQDFNEIVLAALSAQAERENPQPSTNADRIRAMDDKEISVLLSSVTFRRECFIKIPDFLSIQDAYKWLQQPAEEEQT